MAVLADRAYIEMGKKEAAASYIILKKQFAEAFPNGEELLKTMVGIASDHISEDDDDVPFKRHLG